MSEAKENCPPNNAELGSESQPITEVATTVKAPASEDEVVLAASQEPIALGDAPNGCQQAGSEGSHKNEAEGEKEEANKAADDTDEVVEIGEAAITVAEQVLNQNDEDEGEDVGEQKEEEEQIVVVADAPSAVEDPSGVDMCRLDELIKKKKKKQVDLVDNLCGEEEPSTKVGVMSAVDGKKPGEALGSGDVLASSPPITESQEVSSSTKIDEHPPHHHHHHQHHHHHNNYHNNNNNNSHHNNSNKSVRSNARRSSYNSNIRHGSFGSGAGYQNYGLTYLPYKSNFEPSEDARRKADEFLKTIVLTKKN